MGEEKGRRGDVNDTWHFRITYCLKVEHYFPKTLSDAEGQGKTGMSFLRTSHLMFSIYPKDSIIAICGGKTDICFNMSSKIFDF